jgi:hypothetical protein
MREGGVWSTATRGMTNLAMPLATRHSLERWCGRYLSITKFRVAVTGSSPFLLASTCSE